MTEGNAGLRLIPPFDRVYVVSTITTGLYGYPLDEVIDIGIAVADLTRGKVELVYSSAVRYDPDRAMIDPEYVWAFGHTDLTEDDVMNAPSAEEVSKDVRRILKGKHVTSYNPEFDFDKFLYHEPWSLEGVFTETEGLMEMADCIDEIPRTIRDRDTGWRSYPKLDAAYATLCPNDPLKLKENRVMRASTNALMGAHIYFPLDLYPILGDESC